MTAQRGIGRMLVGVLTCVTAMGLVAWGGTKVLVAIFGATNLATTAPSSPDPVGQKDRGEPFPDLSLSDLPDVESRLVNLLKQQYDTQPARTSYSEGINEPWCADFVTWIFKEIGHPLVNPQSGGWRIPGVETLEEYLKATDQWVSPEQPAQLGDIAIYATDSLFGQHTNIVLQVANGQLTTIGGNEHGLIRVTSHALDNPNLKLRGWGRLKLG